MREVRCRVADLLIAAAAGIGIESGLVVWAYASQDLRTRSPLLDVSQLPGARIAEMLLSNSGLVPALSCTIVIQGAIYGALVLAVIQTYRIVVARR